MVFFLALVPALIYPALAWAYRIRLGQKKLELQAMMESTDTIKLFKDAFGVEPELMFKKYFEVKVYALPVGLNMICAWVLALIGLIRIGIPAYLPPALIAFAKNPFWTPVLTAALGGFVWGLYDTVRRYRSGNLTPDALNFAWLRMLVVGSLAPFAGAIFSEGVKAAVSFGLGVFPVKTLSDLVQGQVVKRYSLELSSTPVEPATLQNLQGMTAWTAETLSEADVESCQQLAYSDPLRLVMRTNLPWKVIVDLIDQALLFCYIGDKNKNLRVLGIRGVIELSALYAPTPPLGGESARNAQLDKIAGLVGTSREEVLLLIDTLQFDYQTKLVARLWGDAFDAPADEHHEIRSEAAIMESQLTQTEREMLDAFRKQQAAGATPPPPVPPSPPPPPVTPPEAPAQQAAPPPPPPQQQQ